jgi:AraC family transcriptional regulator
MNLSVVTGESAAAFDPQMFRARLNGRVLASSEALDWPGLQVMKAHLESGEAIAPPVTDNGLCLSLSGAHGRLRRRLTGDRLEQSWCRTGHVHITPARREAWWQGDQPCEILLIFLREALFSRVARETFDRDPVRVELQPRFGLRDGMLEHTGRLLLNEIETPQPGGRLFVESLANALAVHLLRNHSSHVPTERRTKNGLPASRLRRVLDYIEAHLDDGLSLEQMAALAGYSAFHFARLFKVATGRSPHQYVIESRVARAQDLLKGSQTPTAEIAYAVGFSSQSHFVTAFRKAVGVTPRVYRQVMV